MSWFAFSSTDVVAFVCLLGKMREAPFLRQSRGYAAAFFAATLATCKLKVLRGCALLGLQLAVRINLSRSSKSNAALVASQTSVGGGNRCAHSSMEESRRAVRAPALGLPGPLQPSVAV